MAGVWVVLIEAETGAGLVTGAHKVRLTESVVPKWRGLEMLFLPDFLLRWSYIDPQELFAVNRGSSEVAGRK